MTDEKKCEKCGSEFVALVDPTEPEWELDPDDYETGAEVWFCHDCEWHEEATLEEALDEHVRELEWLADRLAEAKS